MPSIVRSVALFAALATLSACGGGGDAAPTTPTPPPAPAPVASVVVSLGSAQLIVGASTVATAETRSSTGASLSGRAVTWSSSNPAVASVSGTGAITALSEGSTSITATSEGRSGSATLVVTPIPVATVTVTLAAPTVTAGSSTIATATLRSASNEALTGRTITWSSSNVAVATVDASGGIVAITPGTTTITASSEGQSGTALLTVTPAPVASVSVSLAQATVTAGSTTAATAELRSASNKLLTGRAVTWASSNTGVATVNGTGIVTAIAPGTTTITATSEGQSGTALLTVSPAPVASVSVQLAQTSVIAGASTLAVATLRSASNQVLTDRNVSWSSSNAGIASVNASGVISALSPGTTTITASSEGRSASALLTVTAPPVAAVSVTLGAQSLQVGQSTIVSAVVRDAAGNVLTGRPVQWSSSAPSVASVNASGFLTAQAIGTAIISASVDGRTGSALLQVTAVAAASVTLSPAAISMVAGDLRVVVATVRDASGNVLSGRQVDWFTSNATIVDGSAIGDTAIITGLRAGTVSVSVQVEGRTASIPVTVQVPVSNVCSQIAGASLFGDDGRYLGRFTNRFDSESVLNEYGSYGSRYATNSTNNEYGTYGSRYNSLSARNPYTSTPPVIVKGGVAIAYYTVNRFLSPSVAPAYALTCNFP